MKTLTLRHAVLSAMIATMCACGAGDPTDDPGASASPKPTPPDSAELAAAGLAEPAAPLDPKDPCRLLEAREVEAVLGEPLASPPYRGWQPGGDRAGRTDEQGDWCWYVTPTRRNIAVSFSAENGGAILGGVGGYVAKAEGATDGLLKLQDGTELTGDWDEAKVLGCCDFMALQGDSLVDVDVGGSHATLEQAGTLANLALGRLAAPLTIDGRAGIPAEDARENTRYNDDDACSLWTPEDIAHLLGPLQGEPERSSGECTITYRGGNGRNQLFVATLDLRDGYRDYRRDNASFAGMAAGINAMGAEQGIGLRAAKTIKGPWDAAEYGPMRFASVRNDVVISVRHSGMSHDELRALLGHAYNKVDAGWKE